MPKVLQIYFWGEVNRDSKGSVEKVIYTISTIISKFFNVSVACKGDRDSTRMEHGVSFFNFIEDRMRNKIFNKILGLKAFTFSKLIKIIEHIRPDILHFHNRFELVDYIYKKLSYKPIIVCHYHRHFQYPCIPHYADLLVAVSTDLSEYILQVTKTAKDLIVLHNPIPDRAIEFRKDDARPRSVVPRILFPGGFQAHKGFNELIEVTDRLNEAGMRFELFLTGPLLDNLVSSGDMNKKSWLFGD